LENSGIGVPKIPKKAATVPKSPNFQVMKQVRHITIDSEGEDGQKSSKLTRHHNRVVTTPFPFQCIIRDPDKVRPVALFNPTWSYPLKTSIVM